jgi:hypothetical protein
MQAELYLPRRRADAADLTEVAIRDSIVGISVACDVKDVEEVGAESDDLFAPHVDVLKQGSVDLAVARGAFGVDASGAEGR